MRRAKYEADKAYERASSQWGRTDRNGQSYAEKQQSEDEDEDEDEQEDDDEQQDEYYNAPPPSPALVQPDYYYVLGISHQASPSEIKKAYRKLARTFHPDSVSGNASLLQEATSLQQQLNSAYGVLNDADEKRLYDFKLKMATSITPPLRPSAAFKAWQNQSGNSSAKKQRT